MNFFELFLTAWAENGSVENWNKSQYQLGWATIGDTPPSVDQFNRTHQVIDQKTNWLYLQLKTAADGLNITLTKDDAEGLVKVLAKYPLSSDLGSAAYKDIPYFQNASLLNAGTVPNARLPIQATRWPTYDEVTDKPQTFPPGGIIIWSGSQAAIPPGWVLCDGNNGTPDLRDRFVIGAGRDYSVGANGGYRDAVAVSHTHTAASGSASVPHTHSGSTNTAGNHAHSGSTGTAGNHAHSYNQVIHRSQWHTGGDGRDSHGPSTATTGQAGNHAHSFTTNAAGNHAHSFTTDSGTNTAHSHSVTVSAAGVSGAGRNMPPYYALCYIMKLAA